MFCFGMNRMQPFRLDMPRSGKADYQYIPVRSGKPVEILDIDRQGQPAAELDRYSDDVGVGQMLRARPGGSQDASYDPGQGAVRVAHPDPCLARQASVHHRVVSRTTIELRQDYARD